MELLREAESLEVSTVADSLRPWLTLDLQRGNDLAGRLLRWKEEQLETVYQVTEVVLERKNRIWARVVVQLLSKSHNINPKVSKWAQCLDDAGQQSHGINYLKQTIRTFTKFDLLLSAPCRSKGGNTLCGASLETLGAVGLVQGSPIQPPAGGDFRQAGHYARQFSRRRREVYGFPETSFG